MAGALFLRHDDGPLLGALPGDLLRLFIGGGHGLEVDHLPPEGVRMEHASDLQRRQQVRRIDEAVALAGAGFKNVAAGFQHVDLLPDGGPGHAEVPGDLFARYEFPIGFAEIFQNFVSHGSLLHKNKQGFL